MRASDVVVQADDWLSKIAEKEWGDPLLYPAIVTATNLKAQSDSSYAAIDNPDLIEPGWKLCLPAQAGEGMAPAETAGLTVAQLANATYSGIYDEPVTLTDGVYEGEPFVEGGPPDRWCSTLTTPKCTVISTATAWRMPPCCW